MHSGVAPHTCNLPWPLMHALRDGPSCMQARTLGPWSSAVELINERERATEKRLAKIQEGGRKGRWYVITCCLC